MFGRACEEPSPALQLHRIRVRTSRLGRVAGSVSERGSYLGTDCNNTLRDSSKPQPWFQHGGAGGFPDGDADLDRHCYTFAPALVPHLPAQRRGGSLVRSTEIYSLRSRSAKYSGQFSDAPEWVRLDCWDRF